MDRLTVKTDQRVNKVFANYPGFAREKMQYLRELVIETAKEILDIVVLEEILKWGEPSFSRKAEVPYQ